MAAAAVQSLSALLQRTTMEDHNEILQSCNAVLAKSKSDLRAQHVKVVALLKLDRYEDCLRTFEEGGDALKQRAGLEFAYALYKCGQAAEAIDVLSKVEVGRGAKHLEAQATYRAEKFRRAAELYDELSQDQAALGNEENDLRINAWATDAQLQWQGNSDFVRHTRPTRDDLEAFETAFNAGSLSLAKGELNQAAILLKRAKELCRTSEDLSPEDKAAEMLPITVQELYVLLRQGKVDDAQSLLDQISIDDIPELSTKKIAQNNISLARHAGANPFLLYKALQNTAISTGSDKLFDYQDDALLNNFYAADILVQKYDGIIRSTSKTLAQSQCPSSSRRVNLLSVYNAAAHARGQSGSKALKELVALLERRPKDLGLLLTVVQLYVSEGNTTSAIDAIERTLQVLDESISEGDKDFRYNPGLLTVLISLYKGEGRKSRIRSELAKAASHWQDRDESSLDLLRAAGASLVHSTDPADLQMAGRLFKSLYEKDHDDKFAIAGYIASQATTDYERVESQLGQMPRLADLVADIDVDALETTGIQLSSSSVAAAAAAIAGARKRPSSEKQGRATKRIRKSRLPKDYDPSKTPDPERWLPLRDRSTYRPKGRKAKQRAADRTQGGVVSEKVDDAGPGVVSQAQQKPQGGGGGASSKKKKKGKR